MINFYETNDLKDYLTTSHNPNFQLHNINIPSRMIITGASGGGKTNALLNLLKLFSAKKGTFDTIKIYCKAKDEPIYEFISDKTKGKIEIIDDLSKLNEIKINDFNSNDNHLIIFDDLLLTKHKIIQEIWIRGRKKNITSIYLSQSYHQTNILLRKNTRYFIFLKLIPRDIKTILKEMSLSVNQETLINMYNYATKDKLNCFLIDNDETDETKKYRKNFNQFLSPEYFKNNDDIPTATPID